MIRKTEHGYKVVSEEGKNLSKPNLNRAAAQRRLAQVEMFKHMGAGARKRRTLGSVGR